MFFGTLFVCRMQLTERQKQVFHYIKEAQRTTGVTPSTRDIQTHFGFSSQTAAVSHLKALEKKGVIRRLEGKARAIIFPEELDRERLVDIPVYGQIPAGMAAADIAQSESEGCITVDVATIGIPRNARTFALKVRGDSMVNAHICDGDTVILEVKEPKQGDVVAALIDGETTLKRFIIENGRPFLKAENDLYPDLIPVMELVAQGVMVALVRQA